MAKIYIGGSSAYLGAETAREAFLQSGHELVEEVAHADWALVATRDEVQSLAGTVDSILVHSDAPRDTFGLSLDARVQGTQVRAYTPWTFGVGDAWRRGLRALKTVEPRNNVSADHDVTYLGPDPATINRGPLEQLPAVVQDMLRDESSLRVSVRRLDTPQLATDPARFALIVEDAYLPGQISSRFWASIATGHLPITTGSALLDQLVPDAAYVDLREFQNVAQLDEYLQSLRQGEVTRRVEMLRAATGELLAHEREQAPVEEKWAFDVRNYIDYREDVAARATTGFAISAPSVLEYRDDQANSELKDLVDQSLRSRPSNVFQSQDRNTVYLSQRSPYMKDERGREAWEAQGFQVVKEPADAYWTIAYNFEELKKLVGRVQNIVFHTYEPHYTAELPFFSRIGETSVHSFSPWTVGLESAWQHWLRGGVFGFFDPDEARPKRGVVVATNKDYLHDRFEEDLTGERYRITIDGNRRGLFDVFGRGWKGIPVQGESRYAEGGFSTPKQAILGDYLINFCVENSHVQGFVTEKIWQSIRGGCLPVFYGSSWLDRIFPSKDYVDLRDYSNSGELLDYLEALSPEEIVRRIRALQRQLRETEERYPRDLSNIQRAQWIDDVASFLRSRNDLANYESLVVAPAADIAVPTEGVVASKSVELHATRIELEREQQRTQHLVKLARSIARERDIANRQVTQLQRAVQGVPALGIRGSLTALARAIKSRFSKEAPPPWLRDVPEPMRRLRGLGKIEVPNLDASHGDFREHRFDRRFLYQMMKQWERGSTSDDDWVAQQIGMIMLCGMSASPAFTVQAFEALEDRFQYVPGSFRERLGFRLYDIVVSQAAGAHARLGQIDEAIELLSRDPEHAPRRFARERAAVSWTRSPKWAMSELRQYLETEPSDTESHIAASRLLAHLDSSTIQETDTRRDRQALLVQANMHLDAGEMREHADLINTYFRAQGLAEPIGASANSFDLSTLDCGSLTTVEEGPLVSVVMSARNAETTVEYALRSLLNQTYRNLEVLVFDDASDDGTRSVIESIAAADSRVKFVASTTQNGTYRNRNLALRSLQGEFLTFHDADDWAHPEHIARHVALMQAEPAIWASRSDWIRVSERGKVQFRRWGMYLEHPNPASAFFRREAIDRIGFFDEVRFGADSEYWNRLIAAEGGDAVCKLPLTLAFGLEQEESLTKSGAGAWTQDHYSAPRAEYSMSQMEWHLGVEQDRLFLNDRGEKREFWAPDHMMKGERAQSERPSLAQAKPRVGVPETVYAVGPVDDAAAVQSTLNSLRAQRDGHWRAVVVADEALHFEWDDPRVAIIDVTGEPSAQQQIAIAAHRLRAIGGGHLVTLRAGDVVPENFNDSLKQQPRRDATMLLSGSDSPLLARWFERDDLPLLPDGSVIDGFWLMPGPTSEPERL